MSQTMTLPHSPSHSGLTIDDSIDCLPLTKERFEYLLTGETFDNDYDYDYDYDGREGDSGGNLYQGYGEVSVDGFTTNFPTVLAEAVVKLCAPQICTPPTIIDLPHYICPCHEALWREYHDPNSPLPTMVEMSVELPYTAQDLTAALQESFKTSVAQTTSTEIFRVEIKAITTLQAAAVKVAFSIRVPQDTFGGLNFPRPGKAHEMCAAMMQSGILKERLLANGVTFSEVLQEAEVVPPSVTTNYCAIVVA
jgi:hypothetical protein